MLNKVVLVGRLVADPTLRYTDDGVPFTVFSLAVERNFLNNNGERDADFINIVTWRKLAENCAQYLNKGRLVSVDGRLQVRKSEDEERTYVNTDVIARNVQFLDFPRGEVDNQLENNQVNDEYVEEEIEAPF